MVLDSSTYWPSTPGSRHASFRPRTGSTHLRQRSHDDRSASNRAARSVATPQASRSRMPAALGRDQGHDGDASSKLSPVRGPGMAVVIGGAPGAGKTTVAGRLAELMWLPHLNKDVVMRS